MLRVGVASGERPRSSLRGRRRPWTRPTTSPSVPVRSCTRRSPALWLQVSIESFFQSGPVAAAALVAAVEAAVGDGLPEDGHLVDAYAGVGLFGAAIGRGGSPPSRATLGRRATPREPGRAGRGRRCRASVGDWRPAAGERIDVVVADPARSGLGRPGVAALMRAGRIASCW